MNLVVKIDFCLCLLICLIQCLHFYQIGGKCGFPGLPRETKIEPKKSVYEEGEKVQYRCPRDNIYTKPQVKKCVSGEWVGPRSTCGFFLINQLSRVKVIDLSNNRTVLEKDTSNYTHEEYPASFYDARGNHLVVSEPHQSHQWWFQFSDIIVFDFFLLNLRIPKSKINSRIAINEIDSFQVRDVRVVSEQNRTCAFDFSTREEWAKIFWFWCTESKVSNNSLTISFTTYANQKMESIGLHQVYLTKLQYCGHPFVPLLAKYIPQNEETQQIQCDSELSVEVPNSSSVLLSDTFNDESYDCIDNPYWAGNPKCLPKNYCELNFDNSTEEISSVKNAYILSKTEWFAIEGTAVYFNCKADHQFIGESVRICLYNSTWNVLGPICRESTNKEPSSFTSPEFMFPIIFVAIVVTIIAITLLVVVINKRKKRIANKSEINKENEFDLYEDIQQVGEENYSEYNYYNYKTTGEYDNSYENPNENKYEPPERGQTSDPYYLTLDANSLSENNNKEEKI